ncbi:MAG TPA: hypothetical protein V6C52_07765 [Coleofasciculaceae cyanobacterium]
MISTLVLIIIVVGLKYRRRPKIHVPCMSLAFALDVALLLYVEWSAHAINTFAKEFTQPTHGGLLFFHVAVSLLMVILYIALILSGKQMLNGDRTRLTLHRNMAGIFLICRLANYITSFMVT